MSGVPHGRGGGGKTSGESGRVAAEDPNTLRSRATARVIVALGEGELELVDGGRSIYLDDTPLLASDGAANFKGVTWEFRAGLPDQPHIAGFDAAETEVAVAVEVKADQPVIRAVAEPDANALRVTLQIPVLTQQDTDDGDLHGSSVDIAIDLRQPGGGWIETVRDTIAGKTTAAYERAYRIELPDDRPVDVRVRRLTADSASTAVQNATHWKSYSLIVDGKFSYPDTAVLALTFDAEQFGSSLPTVSAEVRRVGVAIPSNYDPVNRTYSGVWDGAFKVGRTDNPVWVLWDLMTNRRYGLGDAILPGRIDKWGAYRIARYCDDLVPDGYGGTEPRFTFNGVLQSREDAYQVLQAVASAFRGRPWWAAGSVALAADMPADPAVLVTPANVVDGIITYSGTSLKARHTVVKVTWNDPDDGYRPAIEVVEDAAAILRWGWREAEIVATGCTRRSQARRLGLWLLETEQVETETATWTAGYDHAFSGEQDLAVAGPGQLAAVADPSYAGVRFGGRSPSATLSQVRLDAPVTLAPGQTYTLSIVLPDGAVAERRVTTPAGTASALDVDEPLPVLPVANAVWVLTGSDVAPRPFRIQAIRDDGKGRFTLTALFHDVTKYARIEQGLTLDPPPYVVGNNAFPAPDELRGVESLYWVNGLPHARLSVSWTTVADPNLSRYDARVLTPGGQWQEWVVGRATGFDIAPAEEGRYTVRVVAASYDGRISAPIQRDFIVNGKGAPPGKCAALQALGGVRQAALSWVNPPDSDLSHIEILESPDETLAHAAKIGEARGTSFVRSGLGGLQRRWYWVRAVDLSGNIGDVNSNIGAMAETSLLNVTDVGESIWDEWKDRLVLTVPEIDFAFLDQRIRNTAGSDLAPTLLELSAQAWGRYAAGKALEGDTSRRFAGVATEITKIVDDAKVTAQQVTTIGAEYDANKALVDQRLTALATADSAMSEYVVTLDARTAADANAVRALIAQESLVRSDALAATAETLVLMRSDFAGMSAALAAETTTRATQDNALVEQVQQARAHADSAVAGMASTLRAEAGATYARASYVQTLEASVNGQSVRVQQIAEATTAMGGRVGWVIDNGYAVGLELLNGGYRTSAIVMRADSLVVAMPGYGLETPFAIRAVNGAPKVALTDAVIGDATIRRAAIQDLSVNGQKIEDLACTNIGWASGNLNVSVGMTCTGRPVLCFAVWEEMVNVSVTVTGGGGFGFGMGSAPYTRSSVTVRGSTNGWNVFSFQVGVNASVFCIELRK